MNNWATIRLGDLYAIPSRNGLSRPQRVRGEGYKMVNMGEIFAFDRIDNPPMELVPMSEQEIKKYSIEEGDLLFARQSIVEEGAGKCSIVLSVPEITSFESHLIRVRLKKDIAFPLFYYYYFTSPLGKGTIRTIVTGAAQKGIRGSELQELTVYYPDYDTQKKIAGILSAYDDLIANNERRIALLEEAIHLLYREWFVHLRFPGHEDVAVNAGIPDGWEYVPIGQLLAFSIGGGWGRDDSQPNYSEPGYVIRGTDIPNLLRGDLSTTPLRYHNPSNLKSRILEANDIVLEISNGRIENVGRTLLITNSLLKSYDFPVMCASFCKLLRCSELLPPYFISLYIETLNRGGQLDYFKNPSAAGINNFRFKDFQQNAKVLVPDFVTLRKFQVVADPIHSEMENLSAQVRLLREARDALLPRLMSGKLTV